jgi:hypothetical protein
VPGPSQRVALGALFVLLALALLGIAVAAARAEQWVITIAAAAVGLWLATLAARALRQR